MTLLDRFPDNLENKKIAWIIRHSERLNNLDKLTEKGKKDALNFAQKIKNLPIKAIYVSPSDRCIETGKIILSVFEQDIPLILDNNIAEIGPYVINMQKAIETYNSLGKEEFFRRLLADEKLEGYRIFSQAGKNITTFIKNNTIDYGITLFITHNFIIRMLKYYLGKLSYKHKIPSIKPLDGIIIDIN